MNQQLRDDLRFINKFLYAIQKYRIELENWIRAKERDGINPLKTAKKLFADIEAQEKAAEGMANEIVKPTAIWEEFFQHIKGVGPRLSTSLLAEIGDISRFDTVSCLWAFMAMIAEYVKAKCLKGHKIIMSSDKHKECPIPCNRDSEPCRGKLEYIERIKGEAPKRIRGYHYLFNTRLKMICWKVGEQLVKQGNKHYRNIYDKAKIYYANKARKEGLTIIPAAVLKTKKKADKEKYISEGHIHNRAKRKMVKMFISNLWEAWRLCEGLEVRPPYVIEKLGHQRYISWPEVKQILMDENGKPKSKLKKS